ncbi:hypothetical protein [Longitalea luteola]|uniref:hypothetical protein n=1 Tax=Longitalea luteola TaxID=2812563 RepID=UPI001A9634E2|nr:hypothetical protein [Longitalea luteola]
MSEIKKVINVVDVKPYTPSDLAEIYGTSWKIMNKWLKRLEPHIGERDGRYFTPLQVSKIFEKLGAPAKVEFED